MSISQVFLGPVTSCGHVLDPSHPPFQNSYWSLSQRLLQGTTFTWTASPLRTPLALPAPFILAFQSLNPKATPLPQFCHYPSILIRCYLQCHLPSSHHQIWSLMVFLVTKKVTGALGCPWMVYRHRTHKNRWAVPMWSSQKSFYMEWRCGEWVGREMAILRHFLL